MNKTKLDLVKIELSLNRYSQITTFACWPIVNTSR